MTNFKERTNTLLYKNISLTLYSRNGWCCLCVRGELETGTDCYILTQSSSDHISTSFAFWLGYSTVGHWRPKSPQSAAGSHVGILSPTDSNSNWNWNWPKPSVAPGYIIVLCPPASNVLPLIYTGASLDWWIGRGSIYNMWTYIYSTIKKRHKAKFLRILTSLNSELEFLYFRKFRNKCLIKITNICMIDWLINFKGMSTHLDLFYAEKLRNCK